MPSPLHPAALLALSPARRARTALAASSVIHWDHDGESTEAAFLEEAGSLMLLVSAPIGRRLLDIGTGQVAFGELNSIGDVRLSGDFWPVAGQVADLTMRELRSWHAQCGDCPSRVATDLVGLQVEKVEARLPGEPFRRVDLDDYQQAMPDDIIAVGLRLAAHLNLEHHDAARQAAAALVDVSPDDLLAARVDWIDATGIELSVIDAGGGHRWRAGFAERVTCAEQLPSAVHRWLAG